MHTHVYRYMSILLNVYIKRCEAAPSHFRVGGLSSAIVERILRMAACCQISGV